jgi:hypothetical protein
MSLTTYYIILAVFLAPSLGQASVGGRPAPHSEDIPTVEYCTLINNPALYDGNEIRLRGVYAVSGKNDSKFYSSSCGSGSTLWVEFDPIYRSRSKPDAVKSLAEMRRKSGVRWGRPHVSVLVLHYRSAEVEFIGRFRAANPYKKPEAIETEALLGPIRSAREGYDFVFNVSRVARVNALSQSAKY